MDFKSEAVSMHKSQQYSLKHYVREMSVSRSRH